MTAFFVGGVGSTNRRADEAVYQELREISGDLAGCPARLRRIFKLSCRLDGHDCEIEVGGSPPHGRGVVAGIMDHGHDKAFVVHTTTADGQMDDPLQVPPPPCTR